MALCWRRLLALVAAPLFAGCALTAGVVLQPPPDACPGPGQWAILGPDGPQTLPADRALAHLAKRGVVLLGETHDDAEHHRWQLHTIAGLHALNPRLVLAFEMFPRRVQPALDEWTAGRLDDREFLQRTDWQRVWGHEPELYLPLFHFARMHRIPMLALNVERALVRRVGELGWTAIPPGEREGVTDPAPAGREYTTWLYPSYRDHRPTGTPPAESGSLGEAELRDPAFVRFVEAMLVWDRAMAQGIADRLGQDPAALVVAAVGSGHLRYGYGIPRQLRDLGVAEAAVALPWESTADCAGLVPGLADAVFGVAKRATPAAPPRPRLGITFDRGAEGLVVREVTPGSPAEAAGLRSGDVILRMAGIATTDAASLVAAVRRVAPGTWLPLAIRRGSETHELVAKFPPGP